MGSSGNPCVISYDVGGSHISAAACRSGDYGLGPVARAEQAGLEAGEDFVGLLASLAGQVAPGGASVLGASLAMPGPFDYREGVSWMRHKMPYLYGLNLRQALAERLGWEQPGRIRFLNDAAAFLWGEIGAGAARSVPRVVGITLGTGVGSAFAIDGRVQPGGHGVPPGGEIWNQPFEGGMVEDLISTKSIRSRYLESTGRESEVAEIAAGAADDPAAREVFADFGRDLGRVFRVLLEDFAPQVVVLGGGISRSAGLFLPAAEQELKGVRRELRIATLGDSAALVGAGVAWFSAESATG